MFTEHNVGDSNGVGRVLSPDLDLSSLGDFIHTNGRHRFSLVDSVAVFGRIEFIDSSTHLST
jgi:hypothetical protein